MNLNAVGNTSFSSLIQQLTEELNAKGNEAQNTNLNSIWTTDQSPFSATDNTGINTLLPNNVSAENQVMPLIILILQALFNKDSGEQEQQNVEPNAGNNMDLANLLNLLTDNTAEPAATVAQTTPIGANNSEEMIHKGYVTTTETDKNGNEITTRLYNNGNKTVTTTETDENGNKIITKEHSDGYKVVTTIGTDKNGNEIITKEYASGAKSVTSTEIDKNGNEITTEKLTDIHGKQKIKSTTTTTRETDVNGNEIIITTKDKNNGYKEVTTTKTDENGNEIKTIKKSKSSGDYGLDPGDTTVYDQKEYVNGQMTSASYHGNVSDGTQSHTHKKHEYNDDGSEKSSAYTKFDADTGALTYGQTIDYTSDGKTLFHYQDAFERDGEIIEEKVFKVEHKLVDGEYVLANKEEITDPEQIAEVKAEMSKNKDKDSSASAEAPVEKEAVSAKKTATKEVSKDDASLKSKISKNISAITK